MDLDTVPTPNDVQPLLKNPKPIQTEPKAKTRESIAIPRIWLMPVGAVVFLLLGYFAGREHVKYEIRSALTDAGRAMQETFAGAAGSTSSTVETPEESNPLVNFGDACRSGMVSARLTSVSVGKPKINTLGGDVAEADADALIIAIVFRNEDERKIMRFNENMFGPPRVFLHDDVGNQIRGINYGELNSLVGELTSDTDLLPGKEANHIVVFSIPPEQTEFLICTVDLACLDEEAGKVDVKIPFDVVAK